MSGNVFTANYADNQEQTQTRRAYRALKEAIINLVLMPGYPLLESELAQKLEMSRTPVREAIQMLKSEGLVETISRKGAYVKALSSDDVRLIYEMAECLEGMCAYLFVQRADDQALSELRQCVTELQTALAEDDIEKWISADRNFHLILHKYCGNSYLQESLIRLYDQIHRIRLMTTRVVRHNEASTNDHCQTFQAICAGDAEEARSITQRHWARVRRDTIKMLY